MQLADRFERELVLRVGRAVPLTLAVGACLVLAAALLGLLYSALPTRGVREPAAPAVPAPVAVTAADIQAALAPPRPSPAQPAATASSAFVSSGPSEGARAVAAALQQIRTLVPESSAPWRDVYRTVCRQVFFGNCYGQYQQFVSRGISGHLTAVTALYDAENSAAEFVGLSAANQSYHVNGSNAETKVAALNEVRGILAATPADKRPQYLRVWSSIRVQKEGVRQQSIRTEHERVAAERAAEEVRVVTTNLGKSATRSTASTAAVGAIGLLWTIALALGILAIERNTRALLLKRESVEERL